MKKTKIKTPSLLSELIGKPTAHTCKKKLKCFRCKESINVSNVFFQIPKQRAGLTSKKAHCLRCFDLIFTQTEKELLALEETLRTAQASLAE